jgi:hypothetical protein
MYSGLPLHEVMGQTLKHAGVAVTITSLTDVFAFAVGSVTVRKAGFTKYFSFEVHRRISKE